MGNFSKGHSERATLRLQKGSQAEELACKYLQARGLNLIQRNFRVKCGEIDLIMTDKNYLIYIEVRYRQNNFFCEPIESVNWRKQQRIIRAASMYGFKNKLAQILPSRFDVVAVLGDLSKPDIQWIPDAFWGN